MNCHQYTEDSQFCSALVADLIRTVEIVNRSVGMAVVSEWLRVKKLKVNPDKIEVLLVWGRKSTILCSGRGCIPPKE